jgi:FKBP-type peptidyl-prolyl cis-trans isomerase
MFTKYFDRYFQPVNIEGLDKDTDSDSDIVNEYTRGSERQFLWRSLTKNGSIKKCVLVDGIAAGGRPKLGDTVLVKSQGKLRDGRIIDDHPTLVFNVGEHEVVEGLDLAVQSMHKNELAILSIKPEVAYGDIGRKGDIPGGSRYVYDIELMLSSLAYRFFPEYYSDQCYS